MVEKQNNAVNFAYLNVKAYLLLIRANTNLLGPKLVRMTVMSVLLLTYTKNMAKIKGGKYPCNFRFF